MVLVPLVLALWVGNAVARDGLARTARSLVVALVGLAAAWHALATWLASPVGH